MQCAQLINNIVVKVIEIPEIEENDIQSFIHNILNLDGEWVSTKNHIEQKKTNISINWAYIKDHNIFIPPKPFESWNLNESLDWTAPEKNILRNPLYGYEIESESSDWFYWNETRKKWGVLCTDNLIKREVERTNGLFFISKAVDVSDYDYVSDLQSDVNVICNPKTYKYHEVHPDWSPGFINPIFRKDSYGAKYNITLDNPDKNYCYEFYQTIYDGAPKFYITHTNICDLRIKYPFNGKYRKYLYEYSEELETEHMQQYPFIAARTLTELFRLIIDWDSLYHSDNNRENTAILCHDILASIDMPTSIYNEIVSTTDESILLKYKKYGTLDVRKPEDKIDISDNIIDWLVDLYWDYRNLKFHNDVNIKNYNNLHYYI